MLNAEAKAKQKSGAAGTGFKKEQIKGVKTDGVKKQKQE